MRTCFTLLLLLQILVIQAQPYTIKKLGLEKKTLQQLCHRHRGRQKRLSLVCHRRRTE